VRAPSNKAFQARRSSPCGLGPRPERRRWAYMRNLMLPFLVLILSACDAWMRVKGQLEPPPADYYNCSLLSSSEPSGEALRIPLRELSFEEDVHVAPGTKGDTYFFSAECTGLKWETVSAVYQPGVVVDLGTLKLQQSK